VPYLLLGDDENGIDCSGFFIESMKQWRYPSLPHTHVQGLTASYLFRAVPINIARREQGVLLWGWEAIWFSLSSAWEILDDQEDLVAQDNGDNSYETLLATLLTYFGRSGIVPLQPITDKFKAVGYSPDAASAIKVALANRYRSGETHSFGAGYGGGGAQGSFGNPTTPRVNKNRLWTAPFPAVEAPTYQPFRSISVSDGQGGYYYPFWNIYHHIAVILNRNQVIHSTITSKANGVQITPLGEVLDKSFAFDEATMDAAADEFGAGINLTGDQTILFEDATISVAMPDALGRPGWTVNIQTDIYAKTGIMSAIVNTPYALYWADNIGPTLQDADSDYLEKLGPTRMSDAGHDTLVYAV
jgi:hypothetical protein